PSTLAQAGMGDNAAITSSIGIGVGAVIGVMLGMSLVDKIGRRPPMFIGLGIMVVALVGMGLMERLTQSTATGYVLVTLMIIYVCAFQLGVGVPTWLLISEIFPAPIRATAMSICTFLIWMGNFTVSLIFPPLGELWGASTMFFLFAVVSAISLVFCYRRVPETMGESLDDITNEAES
ncbi:MFS transporter, partial [Nocardia salmonicida]